ncbi:MAG: class I SAM-dependent methyltransferase [Candidatus Omnitrophica bacterium]|nr:class I SAM-dependent methyltransferase [Candidatus Omnitrophota bacterium]
MSRDLKVIYHKKWIKEKAKGDNMSLNQRVFSTMEIFFDFVLHRKFRGKILDVGQGDGSFVKCCQRAGIEAAGIDINDDVNFEHDKLPYEDGQFDIAFLYSVLEHISDPSNLLGEIKRVLVNNGIVVIITPNIDQVKFGFFDDHTHVRPYNPRNIVWLMDSFDFKKAFVGLWTVNKSPYIWRLPEGLQFLYGRILPFTGLNKFAPPFLRGRSKTMLCAFLSQKTER